MIFSPIQFRNLVINNRFVMSPMCMYSCKEGMANDFHLTHYGSRALGGVGLIIVEATGVEPRGRITNECMGIWNDLQAEKLSKITDFVHQNSNSKMGIQLAHSGRKGATQNGVQLPLDAGWETIAPSPLAYKTGERIPHELTENEIKELVQDFKRAAKRAIDAGFDLIEIHAAHGYLIHQFLSPKSNTRTDKYGGNFENRIRFLLEIIEEVNKVLDNDHPLFVRISATEYAENGWDISDSIQLSHILKDKNVDLIDVSSGGNISGAKISLFDGYQVPFSEQIRTETGIKTGAVGLIKTAEQAKNILQTQKADLIFLGRELLRNPFFVLQAAVDNAELDYIPTSYRRAYL
ncbi:MAG: NADPH dehydrogenase NamA [Flavobacteriaceae bacterium]|nr:NADPH dehydrogenase NamA [Flavobacteriaceae bacterium]